MQLPALFLLLFMTHPVHETVSEIEWNAESGCLEVSMRLSVLDAQWIKRQVKPKQDDKAWPIVYLQKRFRVDPPKKDQAKANAKNTAKLKWVGRDEEGSHVWWYFEIHPANKQMPKIVDNRMLWDREDSYINRIVILKNNKPQRAIDLTFRKPSAKLE